MGHIDHLGDVGKIQIVIALHEHDFFLPAGKDLLQLGTGMAELSGQVSALAGLGRAIASGPVGRVGALAYGVRHAMSLRRPRRALPGRLVDRGELTRGRAAR